MSIKSMILLIFLATGLYLLLLLSVYGLQKFIIFQPTPLKKNYKFEFETPHEEVFLPTKDSVLINGIYFKTTTKKKGVVLYLHGNADNLKRWGKYHTDFTKRGYDIFMIDYRGFGKTGGQISEQSYYEDTRLAYDYLLTSELYSDIIIYGRSLGCAMACQLATQVPARKLILETPFDNIKNTFKTRFPILILPWDLNYFFPNDQFIQKVDMPIVIFEAAKDKLVLNKSTEGLIPYLKPSDEFIKIDSAGHKNLSSFAQYQNELTRILQ